MPQDSPTSPFHAAERQLQERAGKRAAIESFAQQAIRPFMPDQHRRFFAKLPFLVVGSVDAAGWPWASILSGEPGFMTSPDATTLQVAATAAKDDPLSAALLPGAPLGTPLGLLGIEIGTRRRNRLNGRLSETTGSGFAVTVDQSFGNCPQYIQTREIDFPRAAKAPRGSEDIAWLTSLSAKDRATIAAADTFFVASAVPAADDPQVEGVDVSHRGGRPGFVAVEGDQLTVPDFSGNHYFNTLGNFLANPKAGLLFVDFAKGDLLLLTGRVELLWDERPEVKAFKGAERAWRFTLDHGLRLKGALPFRAALTDYSPKTLSTGDWDQAAATLAAEAKRAAWRPYRVTRIVEESAVIRSFYLEAADGEALLPFEAGQFLTIRVRPADTALIRTYSLSSAPGDDVYRISVKREAAGLVSNHLHETLKVGDEIEAKAPSGGFFIDAAETRPAILLAGGVGVTPMVAMARHIVKEGQRTRHYRPLHIFHAAQTTDQRAFAEAFRALERQSGGAVRYLSFIGRPAAEEEPSVDFDQRGRITAEALRRFLPLDDYDVYLCGPPAFMQGLYDVLRGLGIRDARIFAETFGPAALTRHPDAGAVAPEVREEADEAVIAFTKSGFEQRWTSGEASLLETAEAHGLTPDYGCRAGACGTCAVKLTSGSVAYRSQPRADLAADQVLICCAVPAKGSARLEIDL
ncbi:MAG: hypothetical protein Kilf2KO_14470 [Rhodospirillales bacterium]